METNQNDARCRTDKMSYPSSTYIGAVRVSNQPSTRTGIVNTDPSQELLQPRVAAVELIDAFKGLAIRLRPGDFHTQEDLVQVMCLAAIECSHPATRYFFMRLANWRARDYLRWWTSPLIRQEPQPDDDFDESLAA